MEKKIFSAYGSDAADRFRNRPDQSSFKEIPQHVAAAINAFWATHHGFAVANPDDIEKQLNDWSGECRRSS